MLVNTTVKDLPPYYHQGVLVAMQSLALQHPQEPKESLVVSTGIVTLLLCEGKWLRLEGTHH